MILFGCHTPCLLKGKQIPRKKNKIYKDHLSSKKFPHPCVFFPPSSHPRTNPIAKPNIDIKHKRIPIHKRHPKRRPSIPNKSNPQRIYHSQPQPSP